MRSLFTSKTRSLGHLLPLLPLATALVEGGDEVAFASGRDRRRDVEQRGFRFFAAGLALDQVPARMRAVASDLTARGIPVPRRWGYDFDNTMAQVFTTVHAPAMALDLEPVVAAFEPDVIVCDVSEYGAPIVAAVAGSPCVSHGWGLPVAERVTSDAARWAAPMWTDRGLDPPDDAGTYRTLHVSLCPPSLDPGDGWPNATIAPDARAVTNRAPAGVDRRATAAPNGVRDRRDRKGTRPGAAVCGDRGAGGRGHQRRRDRRF